MSVFRILYFCRKQKYMNKMLVTLLVIIGGSCLSFAQMRGERGGSHVSKDTLEIKSEIDVATDTGLHQSVIRYDSVYYNYLQMQNAYKKAFKLKNDVFSKRMKESWLGDILKDVLFR